MIPIAFEVAIFYHWSFIVIFINQVIESSQLKLIFASGLDWPLITILIACVTTCCD